MVRSLPDLVAGHGTVTVVSESRGYQVETWSEIARIASMLVPRFRSAGVAPGIPVPITDVPTISMIATIIALVQLGAAPFVVPAVTHARSRQRSIAQLLSRLSAVPSEVAFVDPITFDYLHSAGLVSSEAESFGALQLVRMRSKSGVTSVLGNLVQFSSGTTGTPKPLEISRQGLVRHIWKIIETADLNPVDETMVTWLPLSHDMGLVGGLLMPLVSGMNLVLAPPSAYVADPSIWMRLVAEHGGTVTVGPGSAYGVCGRVLSLPSGSSLRSLRRAFIGAEPIRRDDVDRFNTGAARYGLSDKALYACYGLAEATLAVAFQRGFDGVAFDIIEGGPFEGDGYAAAYTEGAEGQRRLEFAVVGRPLPETSWEVRAHGSICGQRQVGELVVSGDTLYLRAVGGSEPPSEIRTGDLAYQCDLGLVVCGRIDDIIFVGGRKIVPDSIERVVADMLDVSPQKVAAVRSSDADADGVYVFVELRNELADQLVSQIRRRVNAELGIIVQAVNVVAAGAMPRTTSGKIRRRELASVSATSSRS